MKIRWSHPIRRWLFLTSILLVAATLIFLSGKNWLAEKWSESPRVEDWLRAARIEPDDAEYWDRLGRRRQSDIEQLDLPLAISYCQRAVGIQPLGASYWMDLASAYEMAGDPAEARRAFEKAKSVYPISADVAWKYGNFLLRQDELPEAYAEIRRAVATDPKLAITAISRCWRARPDINLILDRVIPPDSKAYLQALDFLVAQREDDAALTVWKRLRGLRSSLELPLAFPLLDELIAGYRAEEAGLVWHQALEAAGWAESQRSDKSLIWDGGFEGNFVNGGFGWRKHDMAGAKIEFDTEAYHSGARSLRVIFDGSANLGFENLVQYVLVEPNTAYRFTAFLRTEKLTTNSGIHFWIFDPRPGAQLRIETPSLTGTHPWTVAHCEFVTEPQTRLIKVVLRRLPSEKFDNKIRGAVWVDDVSLVAATPTKLGTSP